VKLQSPIEIRTKIGNIKYLDKLRKKAKEFRNQPTLAEKTLWYEILTNKKTGYKFTRQKPIGQFVVDFYCSKLLLVIELDGGYHEVRIYHDKERDLYLKRWGIKTLRIINEELNDIGLLKQKITTEINKRKVEL
jgi:leucyl-tRNA synthetase